MIKLQEEVLEERITDTKRMRDAVVKELRVLLKEKDILEKKILEVKKQKAHFETLGEFYKRQRKVE